MQYERPIGLSELPPLYDASAVPSRSTGTRIAMLVGILVALAIPVIVATIVAMQIVDGSAYLTQAEYEQATDTAALAAVFAVFPLYLLFFAVMAPKVSYRRRDCFFLFVPVWSYVFTFVVLWRLTGLAHRDWSHRPEEWVDENAA